LTKIICDMGRAVLDAGGGRGGRACVGCADGGERQAEKVDAE